MTADPAQLLERPGPQHLLVARQARGGRGDARPLPDPRVVGARARGVRAGATPLRAAEHLRRPAHDRQPCLHAVDLPGDEDRLTRNPAFRSKPPLTATHSARLVGALRQVAFGAARSGKAPRRTRVRLHRRPATRPPRDLHQRRWRSRRRGPARRWLHVHLTWPGGDAAQVAVMTPSTTIRRLDWRGRPGEPIAPDLVRILRRRPSSK